MSGIAPSEQAVRTSVSGNTEDSSILFGTAATVAIKKVESALESSLLSSREGVNVALQSPSVSQPTSISSFWQETENMLIGSQEWTAAYQSLPEEKQRYLQVYGQLYDSISNPIDISGTNYDFASDSSGLEEMSLYLEKVSTEIEETVHSIYDEINSIQTNGDWEGEAFAAFQDKCLQYREPLTDLVLLIKTFSSLFASLDEETVALVKNIDAAVGETNIYTNSTNTSPNIIPEETIPVSETERNLGDSVVHQSVLGIETSIGGESQSTKETTSTSDASSLDSSEPIPWWNQEEVSTWCTDANGVDFRLIYDDWAQQYYKLYENGDKVPLTSSEDSGNMRFIKGE